MSLNSITLNKKTFGGNQYCDKCSIEIVYESTLDAPKFVPPVLPVGSEKWVKLLESGKIKKIKGTLCISDPSSPITHCCILGALSLSQNRLFKTSDNFFVDVNTKSKCSHYTLCDYIENNQVVGSALSGDNPFFHVLGGYGLIPYNIKFIINGVTIYEKFLSYLNDFTDLNFKQLAFIIRTLYKLQ